MNQPLVSILLPFKNTVKFAASCLKSIVAQEYKNWEVLAVNDDATDGTALIFQEFALMDSRIRVFHNAGSGIIPALRTAYANARGDLVTRMDSDDLMTTDKISVLVSNLLRHGRNHVSLGQVKYFSDIGISDGYARYEKWLNGLTLTGSNYSGIYKECVIPSPCWMVYKADLESCGHFRPERYPEDYDLAFRFYEQGYTCIPSAKIIHLWRDYQARTSRTSVHYAQNYFLEIKLHYFIKLDHILERPLSVWGAGQKGKTIAKILLTLGIPFYWLCDNPKKTGKQIYGKEMLDYRYLERVRLPQSLVTVANKTSQEQIRSYLTGIHQTEMLDFYFFC